MPCAANWKKNWESMPESAMRLPRLQHDYPNGAMVELRFFLVREYQGELENRIFRDMQWSLPRPAFV